MKRVLLLLQILALSVQGQEIPLEIDSIRISRCYKTYGSANGMSSFDSIISYQYFYNEKIIKDSLRQTTFSQYDTSTSVIKDLYTYDLYTYDFDGNLLLKQSFKLDNTAWKLIEVDSNLFNSNNDLIYKSHWKMYED